MLTVIRLKEYTAEIVASIPEINSGYTCVTRDELTKFMKDHNSEKNQPAFVPLTLARLTEELALPGYFLEMLAGYVVALLVGDETSLQVAQALAEDVRRLTAGRGYSYVEPQPVWKV